MLEFDGIQGEIVGDFLRVYTKDREEAYGFYVAWQLSIGESPVSSNALVVMSSETYIDIGLT